MTFKRPEGSIVSGLDEIKAGDTIYQLYGLSIPFIVVYEVSRGPCKFMDHPEYSIIHESQKDLIVFDTIDLGELGSDRKPYEFSSMNFCGDCNADPDRKSSNDHYIFKNQADAEKALELFKSTVPLSERWPYLEHYGLEYDDLEYSDFEYSDSE